MPNDTDKQLIREFIETNNHTVALQGWLPARRVVRDGVLVLTAESVVFLCRDYAGKLKAELWPRTDIDSFTVADSPVRSRLVLQPRNGVRQQFDVAKSDALEFQAIYQGQPPEELTLSDQVQGIPNTAEPVVSDVSETQEESLSVYPDEELSAEPGLSEPAQEPPPIPDTVAEPSEPDPGPAEESAKPRRQVRRMPHKKVERQLRALNDNLASAFSPHAGFGCAAALVAVGAGLAFGGGMPGSLIAAVILGVFGLIGFSIAVDKGNRWYYRQHIQPQIQKLVKREYLTKDELREAAQAALNNDAPLRKYIEQECRH